MLLQEGQGKPRQPPLFLVVDSIRRMSRPEVAARLDFDEHDGASVNGDQVEFADLVTSATGDDLVTKSLEKTGRGVLASPAKRLQSPCPAPAVGDCREERGVEHGARYGNEEVFNYRP